MYNKPDFIKMSMKVADVYSSYGVTGCVADEGNYYMLGGDGCRDMDLGYQSYTALFPGTNSCYSTLLP